MFLMEWSGTSIFLGLSLLAVVGDAGCGPGTDQGQTTNCATETRAEMYSPGMEKTGMQNALVVRMVESLPAPPTKGDNQWSLQLRDRAGAPITGAQLTVAPYMPDHRHGTSIKPMVQDQGGGEYRVSPINLFMPGLWTVTITAEPVGGPTDQVVFAFCIEG